MGTGEVHSSSKTAAGAQIDRVANQCDLCGKGYLCNLIGRGVIDEQDFFHSRRLAERRVNRRADDIRFIPAGDGDENPQDDAPLPG